MTVPFGAMDRIGVLNTLFPKATIAQPDVTATVPKPSPSEKANREMLVNGITSEQRKAYIPRVSEALAYHLDPNGYSGHQEDLKKAIIHVLLPIPIPDGNKHHGPEAIQEGLGYATTERLDAWRLYLGLPQQSGTFGISQFKPSKGEEDKVYFKINKFTNRIENDPNVTGYTFPKLIKAVKGWGGKMPARDDATGVMGQFNFELGKDERGHYLSYYDSWDLNPNDPKRLAFGPQPSSKIAGAGAKVIGKPFEIYDRIYYDPKTFKPIPETKLQSVVPLKEAKDAKRRK